MNASAAARVVLSTVVLGAAACASTPVERFYVLASGVPAARLPEPPGRSLVVAPAALPDAVDRPQLVVAGPGHQVEILEQKRWAEPLRVGVARVVAETLEAQVTGLQASTRDDALPDPDCRVQLDVRRFEALVGQALTLEALWEVRCQGEAPRSGRTSVREPVANRSTEALIAAAGRAVAGLGRDIAAGFGQ